MQTQKRPSDDVRRQIAALLRELETLRTETKMHMPSAGMELRDRWNRIEQRHTQLQDASRTVRDEALVALRTALIEHRSSLTDLREDLHGDPEC